VPGVLARRLQASEDLETVEVLPETRIDDHADEQQT
jgi:hypothetical protein